MQRNWVVEFSRSVPVCALTMIQLAGAFTPPASAAQDWVQLYRRPDATDSIATAIAVDVSGNVYVVGFSANATNPAAIPADFSTTIAYSNAGTPLWTNHSPLWAARPGSPANHIAVATNGIVFVGGSVPDTNSAYDFMTIAYAPAGVPLWTNTYNGPGNSQEYIMAMAVDGQGDVFVTGWSIGSNGFYDFATLAYSAAGVPLWTNRFKASQTSDDRAYGIAVNAAGNVFVTGNSRNGSPYNDYVTIAYSIAGVPLWTNHYRATAAVGDNVPVAIAMDNHTNVVVTGYAAVTNGTNTVEGYATLRYSASGVPLWTNYYSTAGSVGDSPSALAVDGAGTAFVTGTSFMLSHADYATVAYSSAGVPLWTNRFNGASNAQGAAGAIAVDARGTVFVTGYWNGSYTNEYATLAYSSAGSPWWTNYYVGPGMGTTMADAIAVDNQGNAFVAGTLVDSDGGHDFVTIKYSSNVLPMPLEYQTVDGLLVLTWTKPAFVLQCAPAATGTFTNLPDATSPYTNSFTGSCQFFRLKAN